MSSKLQRSFLLFTLALAAVPAASWAKPPEQVSAITYIDVIPDQFVPGNEEKAQVLLRATHATVKTEPGLVSFTILQETEHPNHFTLLEVWKDRQALDAHAQAGSTRQFRSDLQHLIGSPYLTLVTTPLR